MARKNTRWCDEETLSRDVSGKIYIVTGANSGVGLETTRQLVKQGGHVIMACRRVEAGKAVAVAFADLPGSFEVMALDLASLQSVRDFAQAFKRKYDRLDGLMCNAGLVVMGNEAQYTVDGLEETIGVSYFGHFLLTELLLDRLTATPGARMGILSSVVHAGSEKNRFDIDFEDINWKNRVYQAFTAYSEAKVATVLYAMELADRLKASDVSTASIHPGWARSNFGGYGWMMQVMRFVLLPFRSYITDSNWASAQTSLHVLLSEDAPNHSGAYFSQSSVLYSDKACRDGGWPMTSPNPNARDMDRAKRLVALSRQIVGLEG